MRVAIVNKFRGVVGGVETYLCHIVPALSNQGLELGLWYETELQEARESIPMPAGSALCCIGKVGLSAAETRLAAWKPDLIYTQGFFEHAWEPFLQATAPVVQFVHTYEGTCISGNKTWKFPTARSCNRRFGLQCLLHYFPYRCGGMSPFTMIQHYALQGRRLDSLRRCEVVLTASEHMRDEYLNHGFDPGKVRTAGLLLPQTLIPSCEPPSLEQTIELRLLFCGRMAWLKGGQLLLKAIPLLAEQMDRALQVTFVGDGPERGRWQSQAVSITDRNPQVRIDFLPWSSREQCETLYRQHHLLVVPSIWPEPFGLIGPEASQQGLPAVAFDTGGIRDWLTDGVNGHLASTNPPTARALAEAIIKATSDPKHYLELRQGALQGAQRFNLQHHLQILIATFESVVNRRKRDVQIFSVT